MAKTITINEQTYELQRTLTEDNRWIWMFRSSPKHWWLEVRKPENLKQIELLYGNAEDEEEWQKP